jgi:hypothetical protein
MSYSTEQKVGAILVLLEPGMVIEAWQDGQHDGVVRRSQLMMHD